MQRFLLTAAGLFGAIGLLWFLRSRHHTALPKAPAAAVASGAPGGPGGAAAADALKKLPTLPIEPPAPPQPPQALDRDDEVRTKVNAVLDKYPDVAKLKTLECQPTGACQVTVEVDDLDNFRAPLELLQDPESGLSGDHALIVLSKPEALGPKGTAPYLFHFALTPPEGGVVAPSPAPPPATPSSPPRPTP
jgi:hypothetical protein